MPGFFSSAWTVASQDLSCLLRQKETLLWTFLMPGLFFWFIGTVTGGFAGINADSDHQDALGFVRTDGDPVAAAIAARLEDSNYRLYTPGEEYELEDFNRRLIASDDLGPAVLAGTQRTLRFGTSLEGPTAAYDLFRIQRATIQTLADIALLEVAGTPPTAEAFQALREREPTLTMTTRRARSDGSLRIPSGFEQAVPGTMVMFTLVILLTAGATQLLSERREGLLRRLASAPISRGSVVLGKWGGKFGLALVQIAFAMLLGRLAFGVHWGPHLFTVFALMAAYAAFLSSCALLLGNFATSEGQATALGVLSGNVLGALGGCWWPIEITPEFMQKLALFLPTGWAMDGLHKLLSFGMEPASVLPHIAGMLAGALLLGAGVRRWFKFAP